MKVTLHKTELGNHVQNKKMSNGQPVKMNGINIKIYLKSDKCTINHISCVFSLSYMFRALNLGSSSGTHYTKSHTSYTNLHNCLHELFTIVHIHCLKQIKVKDCGCWFVSVLHWLKIV